MKDRGRGSFEEKEAESDGVQIRTAKWLHNMAVTLTTAFDKSQPLQAVKKVRSKQKC